jgi:hypothetical protein
MARIASARDPVSELGLYDLPVKGVRTAWDLLAWTGQLAGTPVD